MTDEWNFARRIQAPEGCLEGTPPHNREVRGVYGWVFWTAL